jgi:hypothetical protein
MEFLTYLAKEWGVIGQAPVTFLIAMVLAGLLAYALARWAFTARLDTAADRLKFKDEQIADRDRKMAELVQAAGSPTPRIEAREESGEDYSAVIRQLISEYIFAFDDVSADILSGRELPPMSWMNRQLVQMDKGWRITAVRGPIAEIERA